MTDSHRFDPSILREYDIRGTVGTTLDPDDLRAIGRAFGTILARAGGKTAATGYDGRLSSPELEAALADGLRAAGIDVRRVGRGPTPMLYFATFHLGTDSGLMVTGSHNPPEFNGVKMVLKGRSFFGADIQTLGTMAAQGDFAEGAGGEWRFDVLDAYVARLLKDFVGTKPLTVAWDAGNGAAGEALVKLVAGLPGRHILLNEGIDGTFPAHHPDPTVEKNLAQLKDAVAANGCDLGIAFDGDGDRIGVVDSRGRVLWGDQLLAILARDVLAANPGATVIADVKTSRVFFDEIERLGGKSLMWKTGHSHIKSKMAEIGAPLAGEMSAHIFFKDRYYGYDDALYAAVRLLNVLNGTETSLAGLLDAMPKTVSTPEIRFDCADDRKFQVVEEVRARLALEEGIEVHGMDGVRVQSADGWWLLRASNTQPVLVARCEAADAEGLARLKAALSDQLASSGVSAPEL
ncbi:MAG: phosphomannomutase [Rhodospirillales bacterium CG15_BIG_FIL_POST_REV_8_21_14_020_66_15]|nr:MAG: phosphomannomutase [Rhodospirillales bacterium CG15_BIG_FIL_POST_REV_8_21_14_020_66_15]